MKTSASKLAIIYQPGGEIKSNPVNSRTHSKHPLEAPRTPSLSLTGYYPSGKIRLHSHHWVWTFGAGARSLVGK
jgi:hypothetical protein